MQFFKEFALPKVLAILTAIQTDLFQSEIPEEDIRIAFSSYGIKYASDPVQNYLECLLKITVWSIEGHFDEEKQNDTAMILHHFDKKIDRIETTVKEQLHSIATKLDKMQFDNKRELIKKMIRELDEFTEYYNTNFVDCVLEKHCNNETRKQHINDWMNPFYKMRRNMHFFVDKFVNQSSVYEKDSQIFDVVLRILAEDPAKNRPEWTHNKSAQNNIYNLYNYIKGSILRAYRMMLFSITQRNIDGLSVEMGAGTLNEIDHSTRKLEKDIRAISLKARNALLQVSRDIRPNDPVFYEKGSNYDRLTRFMAAVLVDSNRIDRAANLKTSSSVPISGTDWLIDTNIENKINHYPSVPIFHPPLMTNNYFFPMLFIEMKYPNHPHLNLFNQFHFIECKLTYPRVTEIWINPGDEERLYDHFVAYDLSKRQQTYGKVERNNVSLKFHDTTSKHFEDITCFHLCHIDYTSKDNSSIRRFSSQAVLASPGKVVTGLRWLIDSFGIVRMAIKEGTLFGGNIIPGTVEWKNTDRDNSTPIILDHKKRLFNLDDIILPKNFFLSGVQFFTHGNSLALKAFGLRVDDEGMLIDSKPVEFFSDPDENKREEINLDEPDVSENAPQSHQHEIRGTPGKHFVKFQPTDMKKDAGQTTVPYLDTQRVYTSPPTPLGGVGTYYKGSRGFGGFIGLKLISPEFISRLENQGINNSFTEIEKIIGKKENLKNY